MCTRRKPLPIAVLLVISLVSYCLYIYTTNYNSRLLPVNITNTPVILFWSEPLEKVPVGEEIFHRHDCPHKNCWISYEKSHLTMAWAVVFMCHSLPYWRVQQHLNPAQRWIFMCQESPSTIQSYSSYRHWKAPFNWMMTYRSDSDILLPFGGNFPSTVNKPIRSKQELVEIAKSKPKLVAWFVGNCHTASKREDYVRELSKYIHVDIYGNCGHLHSPLDWQSKHESSLAMLNKTYLFYLSFENSLCTDYVTEKFYKVLSYNVVPIVRGGANYSQLVPHKWFINTEDFQSPRHLAEHLKYLQHHLEEYVTYLYHRDQYHYHLMLWHESNIFCEMCEKLNDKTSPIKYYRDKEIFWSPKQCHSPKDLDFKGN